MFSGIIESVGKIVSIENFGEDYRFEFAIGDLDISDMRQGDSIAVNGTCLTIVEKTKKGFIADLSAETLRLTVFGESKSGDKINIERAMAIGDRLNGHIVSGHVDGIGEVISLLEEGRSWRVEIKAPAELMKYIAKKGSICIDGVSLTLNEVTQDTFVINIIPHTFEKTRFGIYKVGQQVNIEVDMIARYLESLLAPNAAG